MPDRMPWLYRIPLILVLWVALVFLIAGLTKPMIRFEQFWGEPPRFVMVLRDGIRIMLRAAAEPGGESVARPNHRRVQHSFDAYVRVRDVDALYSELQGRGANLLYEMLCVLPGVQIRG